MTIPIYCGWCTTIFAQENSFEFNPELNVGIEMFRWQEFDSSGIRLLTENGPRLFFSVAISNTDKSGSGFIYEAAVKGYSGEVDYDGQDSNGVFTSSDTIYAGYVFELNGGYRVQQKIDVDILAGIGFNAWEREIKNNRNAQGNMVSGITEEYTIQYSTLAIGLPQRFANAGGYLKIGVKKPYSTSEDVDNFNVTLSPGRKYSGFISYKLVFDADENSKNLISSVTFYYDSLRFSRSSEKVTVVNSVPLLVRQPKSNLEVIGFAIGRSF